MHCIMNTTWKGWQNKSKQVKFPLNSCYDKFCNLNWHTRRNICHQFLYLWIETWWCIYALDEHMLEIHIKGNLGEKNVSLFFISFSIILQLCTGHGKIEKWLDNYCRYQRQISLGQILYIARTPWCLSVSNRSQFAWEWHHSLWLFPNE